jgi:hypothetical protein
MSHYVDPRDAALLYLVHGRHNLLHRGTQTVVSCGPWAGMRSLLSNRGVPFHEHARLTLSALYMAGPYEHRGLIQGIAGNMVEIGLPISFGLHKFAI